MIYNTKKKQGHGLNFSFHNQGKEEQKCEKIVERFKFERIWKGRFTSWIQWKVSGHFLQNCFQFSFVFFNFIVFVIFKTNLIKIVELNQTMKY